MMLRQSPRRNARNKGLKIKHVLQISVLIGVSIWLVYQVHQSSDKKGSVTTNVAHKLRNVSTKDMYKLGRKELRPKVTENNLKNSKETEEDQLDEQGNENENEDTKDDEIGENEHVVDREESEENIKTESREDGIGGSKNDIAHKGNEKNNKQNEVVNVEKMSPKPKEVEISSSHEDHDPMVRNDIKNMGNEKMMNNEKREKCGTNAMNPASYSAPFVDSKAKDVEQVSDGKADVAGVEENDVLTDLGTLSESERGGSISHDNSATE